MRIDKPSQVTDWLATDPCDRALRRRLPIMDRLCLDASDGGRLIARQHARIEVMRAMSARLPQVPVALAAVRPFPLEGMNAGLVDRICASRDFGPPVLIRRDSCGALELIDGRHRVTAARRCGVRILTSVRA